MTIKAVGLLSGGLDSTLALKVLIDQGIEVEGINFVTPFCRCNKKNGCRNEARAISEKFGIPLKVMALKEEYLDIIKKPRYGYGKNMNPCLDCRIMMFRLAKEYMESINAAFVFTGEVLGERPMSQRRDSMRIIEKDSGLDGYLLRPLCAKLFPPTMPEINGLVDREKLLDIKGRSRKMQISLAKNYSIKDYPCPAGGCLLTDPNFARRIKDLLKNSPDFTLKDIQLLKTGRHLRLDSKTKIIVGRNEEENNVIMNSADHDDIIMEVPGTGSPLTLLKGKLNADNLKSSAIITGRYSDFKDKDSVTVYYGYKLNGLSSHIEVNPHLFDTINFTII